MSLNLIASAAASVARFNSPIDPIAHESLPSTGKSLDAVALNPQPLPPRELGGSLLGRLNAAALNPQPLPPHELGIGSLLRRLDAVALNPQPLPPRELGGSLFGRLNAVALNPQPLPPHELGIGSLLHRFDAVALNPQPLPPRESLLGALKHRFDAVALNPQPLPPRELGGSLFGRLNAVALNPQPLPPGERVGFNPQPEPPEPFFARSQFARARSTRVGEVAQLPESLAARLQDLTVTSRIAPWLLWPRCFYSKALVCQTETDCDGRFRCCFSWWPFHIRNGRLRFDSRPDIIIKVTQTIGAVTRVIYLDPYTSTRWDSSGAYIDLMLDDEDVVCGRGCSPQPSGTTTHFVRVGNDEVYQINQATGAFDLTRPGLIGTINNMAYGGGLNLHAVFGDTLSAAAPQFYYRLSIMGPTTGGNWKDIKAKLTDTRVHKVTHVSEDHDLGPFMVGATHNLYEVRNTATYNWYNQDWIGVWDTSSAGDLDTYVPDEGLYTVRLEVFDNAGVKLTSATVDYRDGTVIPPALLPPMVDACYLVMQIDNKPATVELAFPSVVNSCGVVPITSTPFNITAKVNQENGRLNQWSLTYVKGLNIASGTLDSDSSDTGLAVPVNQAVSSAPMTAGLTGTCAFSLTIGAWAHIRNGYGLVYHTSKSYALAVDACACP